MNRKFLLLGIVLTLCAGGLHGAKVEFDRIRHWAGSGENRAALVIQFNDEKDDVAYVWGYRWNGSASGEDILRAVAAASKSLSALVQYTGNMGSTLDGVGLSKNRKLLDHLNYDFQSAAIEGKVSFGYFEPNTMMGQTTAPGNDTPEMVKGAINISRTEGIINHPLNARRYGYPAYDYDFWQLDTQAADDYEMHWCAGWYDGYWSYWRGTEDKDLSDAAYSGLGMSSAQIADGSINLWNYHPDMTSWEAPDPSENLDYDMDLYEEAMTQPASEVYAVDFDKIRCTVGEGEKYAALVIKFNNGKTPDNLVFGYRWSGGWDNNVDTMLNDICDSNNSIQISRNGNVITGVAYDADGNGLIGDNEHNCATGKWEIFADFEHEAEIYQVSGASFVNPKAVIILTCTPADGKPDYSTDNLTYPDPVDYNNPTGVDEISDASAIRIMPDGSLELDGCSGYDFIITDISGRITMRFHCDSDRMTIPAAGKGIYLIHGKSKDQTITSKFVIK